MCDSKLYYISPQIDTDYVTVESNGKERQCAQVVIQLKKAEGADKINEENLKAWAKFHEPNPLLH